MSTRIGIQINPEDNVVTVAEDAAAGDEVTYMTPDGSRSVAALQSVPLGHKIATVDIGSGETITKYNQAIGTASAAIRLGEHVHTHNVRSAVQGADRES